MREKRGRVWVDLGSAHQDTTTAVHWPSGQVPRADGARHGQQGVTEAPAPKAPSVRTVRL